MHYRMSLKDHFVFVSHIINKAKKGSLDHIVEELSSSKTAIIQK